MNGYSKHELDEDAFGEKQNVGAGLKTFDAFRASPLFPSMRLRWVNRPDTQLNVQADNKPLFLSQNKTQFHNRIPSRRTMDRNHLRNMHIPHLRRVRQLVPRNRKPTLQRRKGRIPPTSNEHRHGRQNALQ